MVIIQLRMSKWNKTKMHKILALHSYSIIYFRGKDDCTMKRIPTGKELFLWALVSLTCTTWIPWLALNSFMVFTFFWWIWTWIQRANVNTGQYSFFQLLSSRYSPSWGYCFCSHWFGSSHGDPFYNPVMERKRI